MSHYTAVCAWTTCSRSGRLSAWGQQGGVWDTSPLGPCRWVLLGVPPGNVALPGTTTSANPSLLPACPHLNVQGWPYPSIIVPVSSPHLVLGEKSWGQTLLPSAFLLSHVPGPACYPFLCLRPLVHHCPSPGCHH